MGKRHFTPEQIIHMLREAEIKRAGGRTTGEVCRDLTIRTERKQNQETVRETLADLFVLHAAPDYIRSDIWCRGHGCSRMAAKA